MARRRNQSCQRPLRRCIFNTFHFIEREKLRGINCVLNSFPITKAMLMVNTELLLDRCRPGATSVEKRTEWPLRLLPLLFPLFFIPLGEKREGEVRGQGTEYYCQLFKNSVSVGYMVFVLLSYIYLLRGFPSSSAGKESTCSAGDPGSLGSEGICYPLQYSWASLAAQMVKNPPAVWETWVRALGWQAPLKEGMATHSCILAWRIPMDRGTCSAIVQRGKKSQTRLRD